MLFMVQFTISNWLSKMAIFNWDPILWDPILYGPTEVVMWRLSIQESLNLNMMMPLELKEGCEDRIQNFCYGMLRFLIYRLEGYENPKLKEGCEGWESRTPWSAIIKPEYDDATGTEGGMWRQNPEFSDWWHSAMVCCDFWFVGLKTMRIPNWRRDVKTENPGHSYLESLNLITEGWMWR